jgi:rSAM/selenodomain-associated transferase 1
MAELPRRKVKSGPARPLLIIMLKQPVMGRVKTRLAREIGASAATAFARAAARTVIARLARDGRWRTVLAVAPDMEAASRIWPASVPRKGQGRGDLGARMRRLLAMPFRPAILIGADIPAVSAPVIAAAFKSLRRNDAVFGPAEDGGYWLVGLNRSAQQTDIFRNVRWSSPHALADTLANLANARIGFVARLGDVDNAASHRRWGHLAGRLILPAASRAEA